MDESEAPASSDLSEELQCAFWGLPLARVGPRAAGLVRMLAYSSLPLPDVAAPPAAGGGRPRGVRLAPAERAERVLAHMLHCGAPAWTLRLGLMRCGGQAVAAVAAGAGRPPAGPPGPPPGRGRPRTRWRSPTCRLRRPRAGACCATAARRAAPRRTRGWPRCTRKSSRRAGARARPRPPTRSPWACARTTATSSARRVVAHVVLERA